MRRRTLLFVWLVLVCPALNGQQSGMPIVAPAPPEASCARAVVACNTTITASIEETDCKIAPRSYGDVYGIEVREDLFVTILMNSSELDSYLTFRDERALEPIPAMGNRPLPVLVHDDNGGGGTNSRVEAAAKPGLFVITARGKKCDSRGQYTLTVKCDTLKCQEGPVAVCLAGMRFRAKAEYKNEDGTFADASASRSSGQRANFYIDGKTGEVSVSDHCEENGYFWVAANFVVAQPVRITVTDTRKGTTKIYEVGPGEALQPIEDRGAFPCL